MAGRSYISLKETDQAILNLNIILDVEPNCYRTLYLRGCAHEGVATSLIKALEDFELAKKLAPREGSSKISQRLSLVKASIRKRLVKIKTDSNNTLSDSDRASVSPIL